MAVLGTLEYLISIDSSKISSGLNAAEGKVKGFGNKLSAWTIAKGKLLGRLIEKAGQATIEFVSGAVEESKAFDKSMSQVAATLGKSTKEIQNLSKFAREMGAKTAFTAKEAADGLNYMALAGYDAEKSMRMLPTVLNLAAAGTMELASASDMVTDAQSALGLTIEQTEVMVDQMAKTSSKTNTSVSQLGAAILTVGGTAKMLKGGTTELNTVLGVLANAGIKGSEGGTALRNVLLSLSAPTSNASKALKKLKVDVFDKQGNMRSLPDIMSDMSKAMDGMSAKQRTDFINKIFNKRDLKSVEALLGMTVEDWSKLQDEIDESAGAADKMAKTQLDNLAGDMTIFGSALSEAKLALVEGLSPALRSMTKTATYWLSDMTKNFKEKGLAGAIETAHRAFNVLTRKMSRSQNPVVKFLGQTLRAFRNGFTWQAFGSTITRGWNLIKDGFEGLGKLVFGENVDGTTKWPTWKDIRGTISETWEGVKTGFSELGKIVFGENVDGTTDWPSWETISETVSGVWDGVKTGFSELGKLVFGENADGTTGWPTSEEILGTAQGILDSAIESFRKLTNKFVFGEKASATDGWPTADDIFNKANDIWTKALEKLSALTGFDFGSLFSVTLPNLAGDVSSWFEDQRRGLEQYLHDTFGYEHNHVADATQDVDQAKLEADAFIRNLESHENNPQALRRDILQSGMEGKIPGLEAFVDFSTGRLKGSTTELKGHVNSWYEQNRTDAITSANEAAVAEQKTAEQRLAKAGENVESATAEYQKNMDKVSGTIQKTYDTLTNSETGFFKSNNGTDPLGLGKVDPKNMDQVADATSRMVNTLQNSMINPMDFADALGLDYTSAEDAASQVNSLIETINQYDEAKKKLEDATKEQEKAKAQVEETKTKQDQYTEALTKTGNAGTEAGNKTTEGMNKTNESASKAAESVSGLKETIDSLKNKTVTITTRYVTIGAPGGGGGGRSDQQQRLAGTTNLLKAKGDWSVPYDNFVALLHRGEMVLTKSQARQFRDSGSGGIDIDGLVSSIVAAVREGMAGATVNSYLDGKSVTGRVNQRNANRDKARRFVTA